MNTPTDTIPTIPEDIVRAPTQIVESEPVIQLSVPELMVLAGLVHQRIERIGRAELERMVADSH